MASLSVFGLVVMLNLLGMAGGGLFARLISLRPAGIRTLAIEIGMQNAGMGIVLALTHFKNQSGVGPSLGDIYSLVHSLGQPVHSYRIPDER